jgi:acyl-CoA synthetase (AMP-forming)/AMP-acid ligase II
MCQKHEAEVLPTTPTFLRMMLMSGAVPDKVPKSLKVITYGTERMDQPTLNELCEALPNIDFRQTFGMSEIGIVRVKSQARDSLYMKLGGEGVETKVVGKILHIRSTTRMIGYLNADSPFDSTGWYNTRDVVEQRGEFYKIVGRTGDVVNVGGLKFMASEVERIALEYPDVEFVKAYPVNNPITGQHLEIIVQPTKVGKFEKIPFVSFLKTKLPSHMTPKRVRIEQIAVGHRFKRA